MQQVVPTLRVTNYARSKAFYVDALGFQIDWEHRFEPKFPVFMQSHGMGWLFFLPSMPGIALWVGWSISTSPTSMPGTPSSRAKGSR
jgi:catechol 2,3-dioxygenase-like lactoylglutathione lyase family enzyme